MGAGKTAAANAARAAGLDTIEADELLEGELGMSIARFFGKRGEEEFRSLEDAEVGQLLEDADGGVIALGGGAVCSERVRRALARHVVVWLQVSAEEAWRRVSGSDRPLAQDRDRFEALHAEREPIYEELADAILPPGDEGLVARALPALQGLREMPHGTHMAWAVSASGEYPAFVGDGVLGTGWWPLEGRRFCVTDTTVGRLYGEAVEPLAGRVEVEPGEQAKTLAEAERVLRELAGLGMSRSDHLVALGGGVVGDLAGFCAATYQRGVDVVQVPTTLVAQVDSAYGGKTGVDLPEAKNYVGAYHLPSAVLADPATLTTLPAEEMAAGFVEVLKTGLIAGGRAVGAGASARGPRSRRARRRDLRLRADQARDRRAGRARQRPPRGAQPGPHRGPRDRGRDGIRALSPRRGGRPGAAGGASPLGRRRAPRGGRAASSPRTDCRPASTPRSTSRRCSRRSSATRSGRPTGSGSCSWSAPASRGSGQRVDPDAVRAAVEELR